MFFSSHQLSEVELIADHIGIRPDGVESVRQEGRVVSILVSHNVEAIVDRTVETLRRLKRGLGVDSSARQPRVE
jgi:hypothetical protein